MEPKAQLTFQYRSATKKLYLWTVGLLLASCLVIVRVRMVEVLEEETLLAMGKLLLACSVPLSVLIRLVFFVQPRLFSRYEIVGEDLFRVRGRKRYQFPMANIERVKISFFSPRFFGGFTLQMKSGQSLSFLSALEDSHRILEKVCAHRSDLLAQSTFDRYMSQSRKVNVSWERLREKCLQWKRLALKYIVIPAVVTATSIGVGNRIGEVLSTWDNIVYQGLIFCLLFLALGFLGNTLEERWVLRRTPWDESRSQFLRDRKFEKTLSHLIDGLFVVAGLGSVALVLWMS